MLHLWACSAVEAGGLRCCTAGPAVPHLLGLQSACHKHAIQDHAACLVCLRKYWRPRRVFDQVWVPVTVEDSLYVLRPSVIAC